MAYTKVFAIRARLDDRVKYAINGEKTELDEWIVYTAPNDLMAVKNALEAQDIEVKGAELTMIPTTPTEVDPKDAAKVMRLVDKLEELEDLQNVYHSMDMTDEVIAALEQED